MSATAGWARPRQKTSNRTSTFRRTLSIADLPRLPIRAGKQVRLVSSESPNDIADIAEKVLERLRQVIPTGFHASQAVPVVPAVAAHS